jgi:hypothetical protein
VRWLRVASLLSIAPVVAPFLWAVASLFVPALRPDDLVLWLGLAALLLNPPAAFLAVLVAAVLWNLPRTEPPPSWCWPAN